MGRSGVQGRVTRLVRRKVGMVLIKGGILPNISQIFFIKSKLTINDKICSFCQILHILKYCRYSIHNQQIHYLQNSYLCLNKYVKYAKIFNNIISFKKTGHVCVPTKTKSGHLKIYKKSGLSRLKVRTWSPWSRVIDPKWGYRRTRLNALS